ncbi:MAG: LD-carboxypeptidase [Myxococcota bacterium]|nr:LD-carboxypeptidase [Myxococcota bacterium]
MAHRFPPPLRPGDPIAVMAPGGPVDAEALATGIARIEERYAPHWHPACLERYGFHAGTDVRRTTALQSALDDKTIRAVLAARGGYGTSRILDHLNLDGLLRATKWIVGSSDVTALLVYLWSQLSLVTIHGPMVAGFERHGDADIDALFDLLEGKPWTPPTGLTAVYQGTATGPMVGGNLTILAHLAGTVEARFADGAVLFLEDVGEAPYRLDRCLTQLKRAGILDRAVGIVVGTLTNCTPGPDGTSARDVMVRNLRPLHIPIALDYPAAHGKRNYPFYHGATVSLEVDQRSARLLPA